MTPTLPPGQRGARRLRSCRDCSPRHYLMCRPTYFDVVYAINPWMNVDIPVDRTLALRQWETLVETYRGLGHRVDVIDGVPGQPDMVFAANCGTVIGGKSLAANMFSPMRRGEEGQYRAWLRAHSTAMAVPEATNEGQGDFAWTGQVLLAGSGYRTDPAAGEVAAWVLGVESIGLELIDPRFYHLDTALFVLGHEQIAYYPGAFSPGSLDVLRDRYPDAIVADEADAMCLGLNAVSDGYHVVIAPGASGLIGQLTARGYQVVPVDLSELLKAGGGAKCCTLELHDAPAISGQERSGSAQIITV